MNHGQLVRHKLRNNLQSLGLLALLALLLGSLAWVIGGEPLLWGTLLGVLILAAANPAIPPRLLMSLYRARPVRPGEAPGLYRLLDALSQRAGLARVPQLHYLPSATVNAFATGRRDDAAILVSDGLLRRLDRRELAAVLAHEVAHIAHDDIRVMALADLVSRITAALSLAGQLLLLLVLPALVLGIDGLPWFPILILLAAPTLSALVQLALSRSREYEADRGAVELSGDPVALASALVKLEQTGRASWEQLLLPGRRLPEPSLLRTHPPTAERVERLRDLASSHATGFSSGSPLCLPRSEPSGCAGSLPLQTPRRHWTGLWY
ncbi:zinc metalloprotease HtpX [Thiocapsa sp. UBA6158]|jgi:heat shock protein HtpX|uniref:zinc metalloprotease HtpX n=1 Tax=Thiocapsa sp. UBA6158 TaxID=1947692 RepID=UPI0025F936F6|nr:zinc metalloprotease HtpX [Thiocapsa sp. UBA6158]